MKHSLFAIVLFSASIFPGQGHASPNNTLPNDSSIINHKLDGKVDEWPAATFIANSETGIQYSIDNDATNLYVAMNIPAFRTQFKMMRTGMTLYFDLKGKKKESHGIEFPVKNGETDLTMQQSRPNRQSNGQPDDGEQKKPDIKMVRKMLALNMVQLKIFGLSDQYPDGQQLMMPGSVNVAYSWDSSDIMHIEYLVPLSMFGDNASLDQHDMSIGWKIHAFERPKPAEGAETAPQGGGYGGQRGGGYSGGYGGGGYRFAPGDPQSMMLEQKFWTKYTFHIPNTKKGF